jgi:hypothetical protein
MEKSPQLHKVVGIFPLCPELVEAIEMISFSLVSTPLPTG